MVKKWPVHADKNIQKLRMGQKITGTTCFVFTIFILSPNFHQGASVRTSVAASNLGAASWCSFTFTCSAISWLRNGIPDSSMDSETADGLEMV
jgi:hypothetical protein